MRVLGVATDMHCASAALVTDGEVTAAVAEERLSRVKHDRSFPARAIRWCLEAAGITMDDIARVAVSANPAIDLGVPDGRYSGRARWHPERLYQVPHGLAGLSGTRFAGTARQALETAAGRPLEVDYVHHHDAHMANAFFLSPFHDAAVITIDGRGEDCTAQWGTGSGASLQVTGSVPYPHSLGLLYGAVTSHLGFRMDRDEWKVMGLAAYGDPAGPAYQRMRNLIEVQGDGQFRLDLNYFTYYLQPAAAAVSEAFTTVFGPPRAPGGPVEDHHRDIAAAVQHVLEDTAAALLAALARQTGHRRLAAGGGTLMNSVLGGKIAALSPFTESFISSCPDDSGTSAGAALHVYSALTGQRGPAQEHNFWGPAWDQDDIDALLTTWGLRARTSADPAGDAALALAEGKVIGWFQGPAEFGQRALGHRSILADPRDPATRDQVNKAVKYREPWRPFAPSVLAADFPLLFGEAAPLVPFMERTLPVLPAARHLIPACVHADGTARPQSVTAADPLFCRLLTRLRELTGVGAVLNTSFNLAEEPVVCSPADAVRTFFTSGLDLLFLGNRVLAK
jgi:carbamoyltransferase